MAECVDLKSVKLVDAETKQIVFAYIRRCQLMLPNDIIPPLVSHWCLLYYFDPDHFDIENCSKDFKLTQNDTIATKSRGSNAAVRLTKRVSAGCHQWTFKLQKVYGGYSFLIGIWKDSYPFQSKLHLNWSTSEQKTYAWNVSEARLSVAGHGKAFGPKCKAGDVVDMILDFNALHLRYRVNGVDLGAAFENIENTVYTAAVSAYKPDDSVELISHQPFVQ